MVNNQKRKLIKLSDIAIIIVSLIICLVVLLFIKNNSKYKLIAQISYDGKIVKEIDLNSASDDIFTLDENKNVSFQIYNHKIKFVNTKCPDKLCENFGYLNKTNDIAICLPNKVSLKLISEKIDVDIIVN